MFSQIILKHWEFCLENSDTHFPHHLHETYLLIFSLLNPLLYLAFISSLFLLCILQDIYYCLIKVYSSLGATLVAQRLKCLPLLTFIYKFHNEILCLQTFFFFWLPAFLFTLAEVFFWILTGQLKKSSFPHVHKFALKTAIHSHRFLVSYSSDFIKSCFFFFWLPLQTVQQWRSCVCYFEHSYTNMSGKA